MLNKYFEEETYLKLKESDNILYKTLELVTRVFEDKLDKSGIPYIVHLMKVYSGVNNLLEKVCALLHDVIEDTEISEVDLKDYGYSDEVIDILLILTKKKGEDYRVYIERIINSNNKHALNIKLADLNHNMDITRIKNPTLNDYERINKRYAPSYEKIKNKLEEMEK